VQAEVRFLCPYEGDMVSRCERKNPVASQLSVYFLHWPADRHAKKSVVFRTDMVSASTSKKHIVGNSGQSFWLLV
jgi:hypothetical protein